MSSLLLILKLLPLVLAIINAIQRQRLTAAATQEVIDDLNRSVEALVAKAVAARATVDQSPEAIDNDPFNRD